MLMIALKFTPAAAPAAVEVLLLLAPEVLLVAVVVADGVNAATGIARLPPSEMYR